MKKFLLFLFAFASLHAFANHLKGGFFTYTYLGPGTNDPTAVRYHVTLTVYMDCAATGAQINDPINFTFFRGTSDTIITNPAVSILKQYNLSKLRDEPCITGDQAICFYKIVIYDLASIELPASATGYTVAYQRCCRITGINNIAGNSNTVGNTYAAFIPGTNLLPTAHNSSATFQINDTVVICRNSYFQYPFTATDPDPGDSLSYAFCDAYTGASQSDPAPNTASPPFVWSFVPYNSGFNGSIPLGSGVTINPRTGLISGIAPSSPGEYVVTVCVSEYRNGVLLTVTRKELHVKIGDCSSIQALPAAFDLNGIKVQPGVAGCKSYTYSFANDVPANPLIQSYYWEFSDGATYNVANPSHTFADTGVYTVKLVLNRGQDCSDSLTTSIKIYPGFFPGFTNVGVCVNKTAQFFDTTKTIYGVVNSWRWDFGESTVSNDTSHLQNPTYIYPSAGTKTVIFVVKNSVGCVDTVTKNIDILTKPPLTLAFKDTLICTGDSVQLHATGDGNFSWTPALNIVNASTADPIVHPPSTTSYFVQLDYQGCIANDTVQVNVVPFVSVTAMADTTICATDTLQLRAATNGLKYLWNNPTTLNDPTLLQPTAHPVANPTTYTITSSIGHCSSTDNVVVTLVPYPVANAGNDTIVCYNTPALLNGSTDGSSFTWSPTNSLTNANTLMPLAKPKKTTVYVLTVYDTKGCPKPGRDTVLVVVNPQVFAFAGRDTAVVVGQVLQFNASGGVNYSWSPPTALNNTAIPNPKAVYDGSFDSIRYALTVTDSIGCGDEATVLVKIFKTNPKIFVPTAFTPNGDGKNEYVAPIAVGISRLDYFRIYNRWGQMVFQTTVNGQGWDGTISGQPQATGTYVWIVQGTDFTGKVVFGKGTVTLIR